MAASRDHSNADFEGTKLVGMDLRRKSFANANLQVADLTESDLSSADLRGANLRGAHLTGAQLVGADLTGACLDAAYLIATNFRNARLDGISLDGAIWDHATTWPDGEPHARAPRWWPALTRAAERDVCAGAAQATSRASSRQRRVGLLLGPSS